MGSGFQPRGGATKVARAGTRVGAARPSVGGGGALLGRDWQAGARRQRQIPRTKSQEPKNEEMFKQEMTETGARRAFWSFPFLIIDTFFELGSWLLEFLHPRHY